MTFGERGRAGGEQVQCEAAGGEDGGRRGGKEGK